MPVDTRQSPIIPWDSPGQTAGGGNAFNDLSFAGAGLTGNVTSNIPIRRVDTRYMTSKVRGMLEVSEGQRPAESFYPAKFLPTLFKDIEIDGHPVVITKGTFVAAAGLDGANGTGAFILPADTTTIGTNVGATAADEFFNYPDKSVCSVLVPANGSDVISYHFYDGDDVAAEYNVYTETGIVTVDAGLTDAQKDPDGVATAAAAAVAAAGGRWVGVAANSAPVGMLYQDAFMDLRGQYLNYEPVNYDRGIMCNWVVELFYIADATILGAPVADAGAVIATPPWNAGSTNITARNYHRLRAFTGFAYGNLEVGGLVQSDISGMTIPYDAANAGVDQIVGRVLAKDFRWPKDQLEYVETYPGSEMPGTETGGLPSHIYWPASVLRNAAGTPLYTDVADIVTAVQAGQIGVARVLLSL